MEQLALFNKSSQSHDRSRCTYSADDPVATIRIVLRLRGGSTNFSNFGGSDKLVERVSDLGPPAVWVTANKNESTSPGGPVTTASTAIGTENRTSGRLIVSPPGFLLVVDVRGMYNNPEEAKGAARLILDRL